VSLVIAANLLPLPNASRLNDIMERIDPTWTANRARFKPFSRLFDTFQQDLTDKGVAIEVKREGFTLVRLPPQSGWVPWTAEHPILRAPRGGDAANFSLFSHGGRVFSGAEA
jgi:hypothetical protein